MKLLTVMLQTILYKFHSPMPYANAKCDKVLASAKLLNFEIVNLFEVTTVVSFKPKNTVL